MAEYTPEEQLQRLSNLQKQYSQINSGRANAFLGDAFSNLGSAIANAPATQAQAQLAWGLPFNANGGVENIFGSGIPAAADAAWSRSYQARADLGNRLLNPTPVAQEQQDPYLAALYSIMGKNTADTSGYDAALKNIGQQRKQAGKRYQTYSAQISDLFGNLGRKSATYAQEQAGIGQQAAVTRSQLAAQQAQQAGETRSADAARLKAATEARAALGLGESASAGAAGDIATLRAEQGLTDQQAVGQTTIDTILANEALAKLVSSRQAGGFDMAGQQAQQELNMSYEDMLSSLANAEAQTKMQKSQAISAGAMSPSEQVAILQAAENYKNAKAQTGEVINPVDKAGVWLAASPAFAESGKALLQRFAPWFVDKAGSLTGDPAKNPAFTNVLTKFQESDAEGAQILKNNPALISLLQVYTGLK